MVAPLLSIDTPRPARLPAATWCSWGLAVLLLFAGLGMAEQHQVGKEVLKDETGARRD